MSDIIPGLGAISRNDFYAEAVRLLPDAGKDAHIQIALSLSRARMKGEGDGYARAAADLTQMAERLGKTAELLTRKRSA